MDFCQKQVSGIHFDLPGIELKEPPNTLCYGSLHRNKSYPFISQILHSNPTCNAHWSQERKMLEVFACWSSRSLSSWINFLSKSQCCRSKINFCQCNMHSSRIKAAYTHGENNKNHQITFSKSRIGFPSLDVSDTDKPKYQVRDPYELTQAILSTNEQYNNCFLLHSTIPSQSHDEFLQTVYGNENSILDQPNSIGHCISADAQMSKGFAQF